MNYKPALIFIKAFGYLGIVINTIRDNFLYDIAKSIIGIGFINPSIVIIIPRFNRFKEVIFIEIIFFCSFAVSIGTEKLSFRFRSSYIVIFSFGVSLAKFQ
ncbi:MAG: hypothetical protein ACTTJM_06535 [Bergeyella cardium]